jgi:hypothetical protein
MQVGYMHNLEAHSLDVVDIFIVFSHEPDRQEIADINSQGRKPLTSPECSKLVLEVVTAAVIALSALTHDAC